MSVARAEAELATLLLVELMAAVAEDEDHQDDDPCEPAPAIVALQPAPAAA